MLVEVEDGWCGGETEFQRKGSSQLSSEAAGGRQGVDKWEEIKRLRYNVANVVALHLTLLRALSLSMGDTNAVVCLTSFGIETQRPLLLLS